MSMLAMGDGRRHSKFKGSIADRKAKISRRKKWWANCTNTQASWIHSKSVAINLRLFTISFLQCYVVCYAVFRNLILKSFV